jgi:long-chain acyl-CoA synthetase
MTDRPWVPHYSPDSQADIGDIAFKHMPDMVRQLSAKHAQKTAFTQVMANGMAGTLSYADVDRMSDEFAAYLRGTLRLNAGDRVAIQMPNSLSYPVVLFGVLKAGCVAVSTNPLYTPPEMVHQFNDSGARVLVISDLFADRLPAVLPKTKVETVVTVRITEWFPLVPGLILRLGMKAKKMLPPITVPHTPLQDALKAGRGVMASGANVKGYMDGVTLDSVANLQYTGGTTGVSKGAMLSHRNLLGNVAQMLAMNTALLKEGQESILTALPLYHIFAFTVNLLLFYQIGGHNVLIPSPRPPKNLQKAFEKYPVTWFSGVNTLFNALANEDWFKANPPKGLKLSVAGGMALHGAVAKRWKEVVGTPVVEGYGLTEAAPVVSFNPVDRVKDGTIGIPFPSTDVRLVDEAGDPVTALNTPGELICRGPQVMLGYWNRPDETAKVLRDGWLYTGDVAQMDEEGYFKIVDRKKDMILVSGFNVYPNEVEDCIANHPGVREVAVIGVPDEHSGEAVKAFIVRKDDGLTPESVIAHCRESLAGYKVPRSVEFRDDLPKSPIGKIIRRELRTAPAGTSAPAPAKA